jgi:very-short-patch-repair endonuclease
LLEAARQLRRDSTRSEDLLWQALRRKEFRGLKFRRQHPLGGFVLDFYCHAAKLAVEVDGSVHHAPDVRARDRDRQTLIEAAGIRVLRVRAEDVESDVNAVLHQIHVVLRTYHSMPRPRNPLPSSLREDTLS